MHKHRNIEALETARRKDEIACQLFRVFLVLPKMFSSLHVGERASDR